MNKTLAAIDFSINSACACVLNDYGYSWYHFGREKTSYVDLGDDRFTRYLLPKRVKGDNYCQSERLKMQDAYALCESITDVMHKHNVTHIGFEGHSFNSKGNSLLELVAYQFLLRTMLINNTSVTLDSMFFYSPITVKAFAGGAKFKKPEMLEKFLNSNDHLLLNNAVFLNIQSKKDSIIRKDTIAKPVDDLVDSYWVLKKMQQDV